MISTAVAAVVCPDGKEKLCSTGQAIRDTGGRGRATSSFIPKTTAADPTRATVRAAAARILRTAASTVTAAPTRTGRMVRAGEIGEPEDERGQPRQPLGRRLVEHDGVAPSDPYLRRHQPPGQQRPSRRSEGCRSDKPSRRRRSAGGLGRRDAVSHWRREPAHAVPAVLTPTAGTCAEPASAGGNPGTMLSTPVMPAPDRSTWRSWAAPRDREMCRRRSPPCRTFAETALRTFLGDRPRAGLSQPPLSG